MDITQKGIITLLKSAITGEKLPLPEEFDLTAAQREINRHGVHTLAFQGALNCGISREHPAMRQLFAQYCRTFMISEGQMKELQRIYQAFDENGIDYMPLKGCNMKARYPKSELRIMGDADILIRMEQYEKITEIMQALGFTYKSETDYHFCWQSQGLFVELHRNLIASCDTDWTPYFTHWWEKAKAVGTCYDMTPENEWLYLFTHFTKHFREYGIGCRHVVDLWVFLRAHPELDEAYMNNALAELQLLEFYENVRRLIRVWFEDAEPDAVTNVLSEYIFVCGIRGNLMTGVLSGAVRNSGKKVGKRARLRYLCRWLFPNLESMQRQYKILKKMPWLLPLVWGFRLIYKGLFDHGHLRTREKALSILTEENVQKRKEMLNYVGLDYH